MKYAKSNRLALLLLHMSIDLDMSCITNTSTQKSRRI